MLSFSQGKQHAMDQSDAVVETIWHMAKASFTANKNQIVLPIGYEKSLSLDVIEELKRRLAQYTGCQAFAVTDPTDSTFRILGLNAAAVDGIRQLSSSNVDYDSTVDQRLSKSNVADDPSTGVDEHMSADKEKLDKIPRPPNAFILYRQHYHPIIKAQNPQLHNNDISKVLGKQWKEESAGVRQMYKAQALDRKAAHLKMYPNYQYAPRKPGEKKRRAGRKAMEAEREREQYDSLPFIDQDGDYFVGSDSGSADGETDLEAIGTNVNENIRKFHLDGDGNVGIVLPANTETTMKQMVEAHNARAKSAGKPTAFAPSKEVQITNSIPPHIQNDDDFFEALIDWEAISEDFKIVQRASGEDLAGLADVEMGNPYLSLSDEDQRALFEQELERSLKLIH